MREGFGLAVLEAMACGTPTVVSRIAPFTEYLPDGVCAWADPHDSAAIAAAMLHTSDPLAAARLRQAGLTLAAQHTWSASARRHLDIYESITTTGAQHA